MHFKELQSEMYVIATSKGFHDNDPPASKVFENVDLVARWLMLAVSELGEAMEALRHDDFDNFKEELADTVIRLMDSAWAMGIDLEKEILKKAEINRNRPYKHNKNC